MKDELRTVQRLIDSSEHPLQALERVAGYLKTNFTEFVWVGFYLTQGRKLVPGPWRGTPAEGGNGIRRRGVVLRAAYSGQTEHDPAAGQSAVPVRSEDAVAGVLAVRYPPGTVLSGSTVTLLEAVARTVGDKAA